MLFQVVPSVLLSMVALITIHMKESDWLLKNFHQSENGLKSYHGEQNRGYHSEIPGSLVSEPKHRDSRVRNRNRLGIGTDISAQVVPESESEPKFQLR